MADVKYQAAWMAGLVDGSGFGCGDFASKRAMKGQGELLTGHDSSGLGGRSGARECGGRRMMLVGENRHTTTTDLGMLGHSRPGASCPEVVVTEKRRWLARNAGRQ